MFNSPPNSSIKMDLAKMLAMHELNQMLEDEGFAVIRQVRTGLASLPLQLNRAKGQLSMSTTYQMSLHPHIVHVVTHSEAFHAALPQEIIESCEIVNQIITRSLDGLPDPATDPEVNARKQQLVTEAKQIFEIIEVFAKKLDLDEKVPSIVQKQLLTKIVTCGLFDAPQLVNNLYARGNIRTKIMEGACVKYDPLQEKVILESERVKSILKTDLIENG